MYYWVQESGLLEVSLCWCLFLVKQWGRIAGESFRLEETFGGFWSKPCSKQSPLHC